MKKLYLNAAVGALALGLAAGPAYALDISVGGGGASASRGGSSASASVGGRSTADVRANVGNIARGRVTIGGRNAASVKANVGGNDASVDIGNGSGPLISGSQSGNPLGGTSNTDIDVNLGDLLGGIGGGGGGDGGGGGGGIDPGEAEEMFNALSSGQQADLKVTCRDVLSAPRRHDAGMVQLCRILVGL